MDECLICAKHRGTGPLHSAHEIWRDDLVVVSHLPPRDAPVLLGHLFVEPLRHAPHIDDLTDVEAAAVGSTVRRAAIGLRAEVDPEHVFSAIIGTAVPHFHQHVYPRYRGTPESIAWHDSAGWAEAPRGGDTEVAALAERLRPYFTGV
ncbi:HIT family protein [Asanoa sp. WMMD1127]|uniref:HIT family protein n=1 Tax=Asanoa sp. WMMD1127 TaxID=3016107 RepID=UPI002416A5C7|nr:HIT family protein [Asanoa sp. WMMD1127]MDG4823524.1 HIT family protein [Asanoa sp. WMMD1127]